MCRRLIIKIPEYHNRLQSVWWCEITWRRGRFAVQPILTYHYANSNYAERRWIPKRIFTAHAQCITLLAAAGWGRVKAMAYVRSHAYPLSLHVFPSSGQFSIMNFPPNLSYFTPIENLYKVDIWGMYSIIVADFAHSRVLSKNFWFIR